MPVCLHWKTTVMPVCLHWKTTEQLELLGFRILFIVRYSKNNRECDVSKKIDVSILRWGRHLKMEKNIQFPKRCVL